MVFYYIISTTYQKNWRLILPCYISGLSHSVYKLIIKSSPFIQVLFLNSLNYRCFENNIIVLETCILVYYISFMKVSIYHDRFCVFWQGKFFFTFHLLSKCSTLSQVRRNIQGQRGFVSAYFRQMRSVFKSEGQILPTTFS